MLFVSLVVSMSVRSPENVVSKPLRFGSCVGLDVPLSLSPLLLVSLREPPSSDGLIAPKMEVIELGKRVIATATSDMMKDPLVNPRLFHAIFRFEPSYAPSTL